MKIALLSDIHANWLALQAVIATDEYSSCDKVIFCGDALGYYYAASEVVSYLQKNCDYAIQGNHDARLLDTHAGLVSYKDKYGSGLDVAKGVLTPMQIDWISNLPHELDIDLHSYSIHLTHGSPLQRHGYLYPDSSEGEWERIFSLGYDCCIFGHSHYPFVREQEGCFIINPGSVGQPRDQGGYAGWAVLELADDGIRVKLQCAPYDVKPLVAAAKQHDPQIDYLQAVLLR